MRRLAALAAAGCVAAVAGSGLAGSAHASAGAAQAGWVKPNSGVFSISPGNHELIGLPGAVLSPTLVRNTTSVPLTVTLTPVLITQSPSGVYDFGTSPADRRDAARVLDISSGGFAMRPHSEATVLERWRPTAGRRAAYAAVIFRATPTGPVHGVRVIDQLLGVDLLGLRGDGPARGRIARLLVSDATAHRLRVAVSLRNVGATFGTPRRVGVVVRDADGRVVTRAVMTPGVILPGVTRDFGAALPVRLAAGSYTATADADLHGHVVGLTQRFSVVPGGLLPAPSLVPGSVRTTGTVGGPARVAVTVRNAGTRAGVPHATVSLYPVRDGVASGRPVATAQLAGGPLAPGRTRTEQVSVGHLHGGSYQAVVRYESPFAPSSPGLQDFTPRPASSIWASIGHFVTSNEIAVIAAAVMALAFAYLVRRLRAAESRPRPGIRLRPLP